jgi:hypothetical protein
MQHKINYTYKHNLSWKHKRNNSLGLSECILEDINNINLGEIGHENAN